MSVETEGVTAGVGAGAGSSLSPLRPAAGLPFNAATYSTPLASPLMARTSLNGVSRTRNPLFGPSTRKTRAGFAVPTISAPAGSTRSVVAWVALVLKCGSPLPSGVIRYTVPLSPVAA